MIQQQKYTWGKTAFSHIEADLVYDCTCFIYILLDVHFACRWSRP